MLKLVADDRQELDSSYEAWLAGAERSLQELVHQPGVRAVKVPVDVQILHQWCRERGYRLDGKARAEFITETLKSMSSG